MAMAIIQMGDGENSNCIHSSRSSPVNEIISRIAESHGTIKVYSRKAIEI